MGNGGIAIHAMTINHSPAVARLLAIGCPDGGAVNIVVGSPLPAVRRWVATRVSWAGAPTFPAAMSLICSRHRLYSDRLTAQPNAESTRPRIGPRRGSGTAAPADGRRHPNSFDAFQVIDRPGRTV